MFNWGSRNMINANVLYICVISRGAGPTHKINNYFVIMVSENLELLLIYFNLISRTYHIFKLIQPFG